VSTESFRYNEFTSYFTQVENPCSHNTWQQCIGLLLLLVQLDTVISMHMLPKRLV